MPLAFFGNSHGFTAEDDFFTSLLMASFPTRFYALKHADFA